MSTIGKIFLVLNLVLAGAFLGWAANSLGKTEELKTAHTAKVNELTDANQKLQTELADTQAALNTERNAKDTAQTERDNLRTDATRLKEELEAAKRANDQLRGDVAKINETMTGLNERLQQIEQTKDAAHELAMRMQSERDAAVRRADEAEMARRTAEETRSTAELDIAQLERDLKSARGQADRLEAEIAQLVAVHGIARTGTAQPDLDARVVQVDYSLKPGLVALNVGSNAGVKRGHTFEIYSGTTYKGRVRVETVHPDMCSAVITLAQNGTTINAGDSASSHL
jgi:hypothetical protein